MPNFEQWHVHFQGFKVLLNLRGGLPIIEQNKALRMSLFWIEINGATDLDSVPHFPAPRQFLPSLQERSFVTTATFQSQPQVSPWLQEFPQHIQFDHLLGSLSYLSTTFTSKSLEGEFYDDGNFAGFWLYPILHELLSIQQAVDTEVLGELQQEALRLGSILYLTELRNYLKVYPVRYNVQLAKAQVLLENDHSEWGALGVARLWILAMCWMLGPSNDDKNWILLCIARSGMYSSVPAWDDFLRDIKSWLWVEVAFAKHIPALQSCWLALETAIVTDTQT